jgi:hypothetical protein
LTWQGASRAANLRMHKESHSEHDIIMEGYSNEFYDDAQSLLQPSTPMTTGCTFKLWTATELFLSWISSIAVCLSNLFGQGISTKVTSSACFSTPKVGSAFVKSDCEGPESSLACKSTRIQSMMQRKEEFASDAEFDIEVSRDHWSKTTEATGAETNKEVFESLKKRWGSFFVDRGHLWVMGEKIAEGGQAEIFKAARSYPHAAGKFKEGYVLKVFKQGNALEYLQHQFPQGMLHNSDYSGFGFEHYAIKNVLGGILLKDGRFAFEMWGDWGDLRKLIDMRMQQNGNCCPPFTDEEVGHILLDIAKGMKQLHKNKIIHRDLKASNVLVVRYKDYGGTTFVPANDNFHCAVADYECSHGIAGTAYWRAPEVLLGVKNRSIKPHFFSMKADIYSYGMTCYEVLTGKVPFEDLPLTAYDVVLDGGRPYLPDHIHPIYKGLLTRCWHSKPSQRPSFVDIVDDFQKFGIGKWA